MRRCKSRKPMPRKSTWKSLQGKIAPVAGATRGAGRGIVVALAADPRAMKRTGRVFSSWALAREYGFTDLDGSQPHWGDYARRKYGRYKICDDKFCSYWVPGLIELIFPDWF